MQSLTSYYQLLFLHSTFCDVMHPITVKRTFFFEGRYLTVLVYAFEDYVSYISAQWCGVSSFPFTVIDLKCHCPKFNHFEMSQTCLVLHQTHAFIWGECEKECCFSPPAEEGPSCFQSSKWPMILNVPLGKGVYPPSFSTLTLTSWKQAK